MTQAHSLDKSKIRVLFLEGIDSSARTIFEEHGYTNVQLLPRALEGAALRDALEDVHILGIRSRTQLTKDVLQSAPKLIAVGCFCIGTNQVNLKTAAENGIPVFNAPHSNTRSVAELVIGLSVMLLRGIFQKSQAAHRNTWLKSARDSHEIRAKTLGIIGYGHIGSQVSVLAEAMGMQVVFYDIMPKLPLGNARQAESLENVLERADIVTLHVPEDESTRQLIGPRELGRMKPGSVLINASRGTVVDIEALNAVLDNKHLAGAAIDVFPTEPKSLETPFESVLVGRENVILTPHIGGSTVEAQQNIGREVATKLAYFSDRGSTESAVNFPAVHLQANNAAHRMLHIHRNTPGILRAITSELADRGINILGQYLQTNADIGYVVLDIDPSVPRADIRALRTTLAGIPGTIRTRHLY